MRKDRAQGGERDKVTELASPYGNKVSRMLPSISSLLARIVEATEFWSAIAGAVVGGAIALAGQVLALRAARKQQESDQRRIQQALANSLLFKLIRIHSDFYGMHRHIEECFEKAIKDGSTGEPWQFVLPLANFPDHVHLSSEEMGMLLAQKDDNVFNSTLSIDIRHNSLIDAFKAWNAERWELTQKLKHDQAIGSMLSGALSKEQFFALRPRMINVNSLIEHVRRDSKVGSDDSAVTLASVNKLLREKLDLRYKIEPNAKNPSQ